MALPASGPISMDAIRIELGVPSQSPFGLNEARSGTYVTLNVNSPTLPPSSGTVSLSDWYSYDQSAASCDCYTITNEDSITGNYSWTGCDGGSYSANIGSGDTQVRCLQGGTVITINSGLLTPTYCASSCTVDNDCLSCL
jgi:hypothetical protein